MDDYDDSDSSFDDDRDNDSVDCVHAW